MTDGMQNTDTAEQSAGTNSAEDRLKALEAESDIAADYLEELLDIADLDGDIDMDIDGDRAAVSIVGAELNNLVGENGKVLEALQELTRLAVYRETGERSRLMLDVSNYRANRKAELEEVGRKAVEEAKATGTPVRYAAARVTTAQAATCATTSDQLVSCLGQALQIGTGDNTNRSAPTLTSGGVHFTSLAGNGAHFCGTGVALEIYCWGIAAYADVSVFPIVGDPGEVTRC